MFPNLYYFSALRITGSFFFSYLEIYITSLWAVARLLCCRTVHPSPAVWPHPCDCCLPPCAWHIFAALRDHCSLSLRFTLLVCFCFCKRGSTAFVFYAQFISFTTTSSISIYFPTNGRIFDWLVELCYCPHFAYPFIHPCTLPSSPFLDCCAINMVCTSLCYTDSILFGSIPGSETAMLCDDSIFSYWWNSHMIYHVGSNIAPKGGRENFFSFLFFSSLIAFIIVCLFYNCHSKGDKTISHCGFIFYFSDN